MHIYLQTVPISMQIIMSCTAENSWY